MSTSGLSAEEWFWGPRMAGGQAWHESGRPMRPVWPTAKPLDPVSIPLCLPTGTGAERDRNERLPRGLAMLPPPPPHLDAAATCTGISSWPDTALGALASCPSCWGPQRPQRARVQGHSLACPRRPSMAEAMASGDRVRHPWWL